jgi:hypothetical protein
MIRSRPQRSRRKCWPKKVLASPAASYIAVLEEKTHLLCPHPVPRIAICACDRCVRAVCRVLLCESVSECDIKTRSTKLEDRATTTTCEAPHRAHTTTHLRLRSHATCHDATPGAPWSRRLLTLRMPRVLNKEKMHQVLEARNASKLAGGRDRTLYIIVSSYHLLRV